MATHDAILDYLATHWRGHLPLATTFWINGISLTLVWLAADAWLDANQWHAFVREPVLFFVAVALALVFFVILPTWQLTGLWRGCERHIEHKGTILAGRAAQFGAVSIMLLVISRVFGQAGTVVTLFPVVLDTGAQATRVTVLPGGREIEISGGLRPGTANRVADLVRDLGSVRRLRLNVTGGGLHEARALANVIATHALNTYVTETCAGACSVPFSAGRYRYLGHAAKLGLWEPGLQIVWFPERDELRRIGLVDMVLGGTSAEGDGRREHAAQPAAQ